MKKTNTPESVMKLIEVLEKSNSELNAKLIESTRVAQEIDRSSKEKISALEDEINRLTVDRDGWKFSAKKWQEDRLAEENRRLEIERKLRDSPSIPEGVFVVRRDWSSTSAAINAIESIFLSMESAVNYISSMYNKPSGYDVVWHGPSSGEKYRLCQVRTKSQEMAFTQFSICYVIINRSK